ncbi:MAG: hypothetical protein A2252_07250 [Elusimicrobia bacterium RIFOXYA2_FULL_39_19]|nr:MAG: hypothetical protein A2252_07250 [Elusimicrobia bacterium RIFOXYA2_FULL_39_19]
MPKLTFSGGVNPYSYKATTKNLQITDLQIPSRVVIPIVQNLNDEVSVTVIKDEYVSIGQKIGEIKGLNCSPVHASISGKVTDICMWNHPVISLPVLSVVIDSDFKDKKITPKKTHWDYFRYSPEDLVKVIREAGITGLNSGFLSVYSKNALLKEIDTVLVNGCESEPSTTSENRLMIEHAYEVIEGLKIIMYIMDVHKSHIAVEDNSDEAIESLKKVVFKAPNVSIKILKTKYPQNGQRQLIDAVLDKTVHSGTSVTDSGIVIESISDCYAIYQAVVEAKPVTSRVVTVSGSLIEKPGNYNVRIGTLFSDLLDQCGYKKETEKKMKIILGASMTGISQVILDVPVIRNMSGIFTMKEDNVNPKTHACIRCTKCIKACPMNLMPNFISIYAESFKWDECLKYHPEDCIECGCCAYECIAKRPIVQQIKLAKQYKEELHVKA